KRRPAEVLCTACNADPKIHMMTFCGWDLQHRPVMYLSYKWSHPERRNDVDAAIEHNLEIFEHLRSLMPLGVEQWICITDFVSYSYWKDGASKVGKTVVEMLLNHYPERLGLQILVDPPTTFWLLWKLLSPLLDERTKKKIVMVYTNAKPNIDDVFPT